MEQIEDCEGSLTACDFAVLVPIVVAPINVVEQRIENHMVQLLSIPIVQVPEQFVYTTDLWTIQAPEPPPSFLTPLLI